ncbi:MAG: hypothetical protein HKO96_00950 [Flavobacteriaceae bacterium]|nr:hypothetical protein [Flavobacteriaceae bacterium]
MKIMSFLLAGLILVQSVSFSIQELAQLDELVEHARFHKAEYGDNFFVFLSKHYGDQKSQHDRDNQNERQEHDQLPFNCQHQLLSSIVFFMHNISLLNGSTDFSAEQQALFFYISPVSSFHKKGILQPPRFA